MATAGARSPAVALAALALAGLGGCGGAGTTVAAGGSPDLAGSWHLVSGRDAEGTLGLPAGREVTLVVKGPDASGTSGCNLYGATVAIDGRSVSFGQIGGTEMACEPQVMELERRYLAGLSATDLAERSGDTLTFSGSDTTFVFERDAPAVDADLIGTPWVLESLVDGESVSSTVPGGRLVFREDGTFVASSGCGDLLGSFRVHDGAVAVSGFVDEPVPAKPCSEQVIAQREHVVDVLREGFEAQVDGDRLTLTSAQGLGLDFRAG